MMATGRQEIGNGYLDLHIGGLRGRVYGGPYARKPARMFGVRLAKELSNLQADVVCPIRDFDVPELSDLHHALKMAIKALAYGREVYVGCMGGWGRTGLFLACMARLAYETMPWYSKLWDRVVRFFGEGKPFDCVTYVRAFYSDRAVETSDQVDFAHNADLGPVIRWAQKQDYI